MRLLRVAFLAAAALVCTGCRLDLTLDVDVDRTGGGTLAIEVAADEELRDLAEEAGADPLGDLVASAQGLEGWRVTEGTDDAGTRTVRLLAGFDDPEEFAELRDDLVSALAADEVTLVEQLDIAVGEDDVTFDAALAARPTRAVRDYGMTPRRVVRQLRRTDAFGYQLRVRLPGEILESNGTAADDGTQQWSIAPGERVTAHARSTRPGPPWIRAAIGAVAGGALAAAVLWLITRRRRAG